MEKFKFQNAPAPREEHKEKSEHAPEPEFLRGFSEKEKFRLMENLGSIELTKGCSVACKFCGFNAEPKVTGRIPFQNLQYIAENYSASLPEIKNFMLYWASDPLDYEDNGKNYADVLALFHDRGIKPFTSTAYPKGKEKVFAEMMDKGLIDRVSVSRQNIKRLEREGWLTQDEDGVISSPHKAIADMMPYRKKLPKDEEYISAGRAFREEKQDSPGGIECQSGVLLRTDGFYNNILCTPSKEHQTGTILQKITPENIKKNLDQNNFPKTVDELIKYGIVRLQERELFGDYQYIIFEESGRDKKYYVEYDPKNLKIIDVEGINDSDKETLKLYTDTKQSIDETNERTEQLTIIRSITGDRPITEKMKKSPFYKKLLAVVQEYLEDFVTSPNWKTDNFKGFVYYDLSETKDAKDDEVLQDHREEINALIQSFKNAFELARDGVMKDDKKTVDEIEKKFMDKLFNSLKNGVINPPYFTRGLSEEQKQGTIRYLKKIFNQ